MTLGVVALVLGYIILRNKLLELNFNNQTLASIFGSLIILMVLLYNFLRAHGIKSSLIKIAMWQAIFLIIVLIYAYRFELNDVTSRVLAVLAPSHNWSNKKGQIMIARNQDGHFYIKADINNATVKFMIDTGASDIALTKSDAIKLKLDLSKLAYTKSYSTANGISHAAPITLTELKIGDKIFNNVRAHVSSGKLDISLLGMSVIGLFKSFNIDKDILILSY